MTGGRRIAYARMAAARFDRSEAEFAPAVTDAIHQYLAHLRRVLDRTSSLTAAGAPERKPTPSGEFKVQEFSAKDADATAELLKAPDVWDGIVAKTVMPAYEKMLGPILKSGLDNPGTFGTVTAWRNDWLAQRRQALVGIPDQVSGQLRTALRETAAKDGTSVDDARGLASKMLADGYPSWQGRAQLIARTETVNANNQGSLASFSALAGATGQAATKTWLATPDARTREDHAAVDGVTVGIDDVFDVGGYSMNGPGDPSAGAEEVCNCRCAMTYDFPDGTSEDAPATDDGGDPSSLDPAVVDDGSDSPVVDSGGTGDGSIFTDILSKVLSGADPAAEDAASAADAADAADSADLADAGPADYRALSDDDLSAAMGTASDDQVDQIVAELDRRDKAERKNEQERTRRNAKKANANAAKDAEFNARLDQGDDPEQAYEEVYGKTIEKQRREQAISSLRENGYSGRNFDELTSQAWNELAVEQRWDAEQPTRGVFFKGVTNPDEKRKVLDLFTKSEAYARANASEELRQYWQTHGRTTLADFRASMLGGKITGRSVQPWY